MLYLAPASPTRNDDRNALARLRRLARERGLRILKDWTGTWSLVDAKIEPQRALVGLVHVSLAKIEAELGRPLPAPRQRSLKASLRRAERLVEALRAYRAGAMAYQAAQAKAGAVKPEIEAAKEGV